MIAIPASSYYTTISNHRVYLKWKVTVPCLLYSHVPGKSLLRAHYTRRIRYRDHGKSFYSFEACFGEGKGQSLR